MQEGEGRRHWGTAGHCYLPSQEDHLLPDYCWRRVTETAESKYVAKGRPPYLYVPGCQKKDQGVLSDASSWLFKACYSVAAKAWAQSGDFPSLLTVLALRIKYGHAL